MAVQWFNPYYVFGGEGGSGTGKVFTKTENGLVPAPGASAGDDLVLRSDGTWGQGGGGSATVGLGKQANQAMWPGVYNKTSESPVPSLGQWNFKDPENFYQEMQSLPGFYWGVYAIQTVRNVGYLLEYLRGEDVKASIIKFIKYCHSLGCPVFASWGADRNGEYFYICTINTINQYPSTRKVADGMAVRGLLSSPDMTSNPTLNYYKFSIPESEEIALPSVNESGEFSNVKITETGIVLTVRSTGVEVSSDGFTGYYMTPNLDAQYPAPDPAKGETLPYSPNYVGGCLSANISGYNNYGTLYSIKYDSGNLTFINTQGATVITMPGATATGEDELTLDDLQKIVYNEESSPKKLEIYDKTGILRFTVNDSSAGA